MRGAYRIVSGLYPGQRRGGELFRRVLRRIAGAESALARGAVEGRPGGSDWREDELFRRVLRRIAGAESALASGRVEERREKYFRKYYLFIDPRD
jgi:hypothetical protein